MPALAFLAVAGLVLTALIRCRCEAKEQQFTCDSHQPTHRPARAPVPQRNKNSHQYTSTRARHDLASSTCCSAQIRA
jgi:hypothetical protein